ncbi:MAG: metal ABC transporter permease [Phycisphaeraceae bacterium]|nr:metal ABC transporter permease [Phycisphaeraceae bacterium]
MSEVIEFFVMQIVLLAIVLVLHTYIGLHIVRRTLIFSDLVLDQLAAFGAMVGIGYGVAYGSVASYLWSGGAVLIGALLLALIRPRTRAIPREAVIGIMYVMALVASLLWADKLPGGAGLVTKTLAGAMLWVTWPLVWATAAVYLVLIVFHVFYRHRFIALAQASETVPHERWWDFLLFMTQGIITILIVPIAGVLLAYAFLMIPATIALLYTRSWSKAVWVGWGVGFGACCSGVGLSYCLNLPYGPTLVLCLGVCFSGPLWENMSVEHNDRGGT